MSLLLGAFAAVQYNDPDPVRWMAIYGTAAVVSALAAFRRIPWSVPAQVAGGAAVWAAAWTSRVIGRPVDLHAVFGTSHMISEAVEETREALGLWIVAAWMAFSAFHAWRTSRAAAPR